MRILLVGNYPPDAQESMLRYAQLMHAGLIDAGHDAHLVAPLPALNRTGLPPRGIWKWLGYVDKYGISVPVLRRAARQADIVHICDHSNAVYAALQPDVPHVVTCHDLLAVRGAMGDDTDCPATFTGKLLQRGILRGLSKANAIACVSSATLGDLNRLIPDYAGESLLVPNALNYPYQVLDPEVAARRLSTIPDLNIQRPFLLNVGSNLRRKNREAVLQSVAAAAPAWDGQVVFAGQPLTPELHELANSLRIADRLVEVGKPSCEVLEALYNAAAALHFPSRFEGFGWPVLEAQACGCPVICGDREPLPEVSGGAALMCDPDDINGLAAAILELTGQPSLHDDLRRRGLENAARFGREAMVERFVSLYRRLAPTA